jgi:hypothetical protein
MKTTLKVFGIICIAIGGLAILASVGDEDFAAFVGGALFLANGIIDVICVKRMN